MTTLILEGHRCGPRARLGTSEASCILSPSHVAGQSSSDGGRQGRSGNLGYQYVMRNCIKGSCQVYRHTIDILASGSERSSLKINVHLPVHLLLESYVFGACTYACERGSHGSNDSRLLVVEPPRGRSFIWQIGVNSSIQDRRQVDRGFLWSRVSCTRQR